MTFLHGRVHVVAYGWFLIFGCAFGAAASAQSFTPYLVKDIRLGSGNRVNGDLTNVNGTLFFRGSSGVGTGTLWISNGTEAGTVRVKEGEPTGVLKELTRTSYWENVAMLVRRITTFSAGQG